MNKCEHPGCAAKEPTHTLFNAGKGYFCAPHFTPERQATEPHPDHIKTKRRKSK